MSCSGLHCSGCAAGAAVPPVAFAALYGAVWLAEHIIEVVITSGACAALTVAVVAWLFRMGDRRDARQRAAASVWTVRADALPPRIREPLTDSARPAIAPASQINLNITVTPGQLAALMQHYTEGK